MNVEVAYIVNSVFTSRTYYLYLPGSPDVWLVDCGDVDVLVHKLEHLLKVGFEVKGVLLTHAHYDHIYGLPRLKALFPDVKVYTNEMGRKMLGSEKLNMSKYHEDPITFETENVEICNEGDEIVLYEGINAKVYFTPGHNPSCLTFEVGGFLFTGDAYIPGVKVVTHLPGSNKQLAMQSLEKIIELAKGKVVYSGHEVMAETNIHLS